MKNTNERFEKFGNVMIDIETLSNKTNAAIVEIAAVEFNKKNGNIGETFHRKIKSDSWFDLPSRDVNADTLKWWLKQSEEARKNIYEDKADDVPIYDALSELALFIKDCDNKSQIQDDDRSVVVWSNGSVFDISILENAYNAIQSIKIPWKFWAINDVRTIVALNPEIKQNCQFEGNPHCALDDCMHQIKYLSQTLDSIMIKEPISTMETITSRPYYLVMYLPIEAFNKPYYDFPYASFKYNEKQIRLEVNLKEPRLIGWENYPLYDEFIRIGDKCTYVLLDINYNLLATRFDNVPNKLIPPKDGSYGKYINFKIKKDGHLLGWDNYDEMDFSEFNMYVR